MCVIGRIGDNKMLLIGLCIVGKKVGMCILFVSILVKWIDKCGMCLLNIWLSVVVLIV